MIILNFIFKIQCSNFLIQFIKKKKKVDERNFYLLEFIQEFNLFVYGDSGPKNYILKKIGLQCLRTEKKIILKIKLYIFFYYKLREKILQ